jgi:glutamate racemase
MRHVSAATDPRDRPIAVFDSGVGGLTVLHELLVRLPREDFVYLGDSARFPYGERTQAELEAFAMDIAEELISRRAKLLVVACNSMTAAALPALQQRMLETTLGVDVIGVVRPEAARAVAVTRSGRIGLLATRATVASRAYERAVTAVDPHVDLLSIACPELASLIQDPPTGELFSRELEDAVRRSCAPLVEAGVDTVILGCTHYPLVRPMLQRLLGPAVTLVTSGSALARQAEHALGSRDLAARRTSEGTYSFLCTGDVGAFRALGTRFLQMPLTEVVPVTLAGALPPVGSGAAARSADA